MCNLSPLYSNAVNRKLIAIRMPSGYTFLVCLGSLLGVFRIVGSSSGLVLVSVCLGFSSFGFSLFFLICFDLVAGSGGGKNSEVQKKSSLRWLHSPFYNGECRVLVKRIRNMF